MYNNCLLLAFVLSLVFTNQFLSARLLDLSEFETRGFEGRGELEFNSPEGIVVTPSGDIVVADYGNNRLQVLNSEGSFIRFIPQVRTDIQPGTPQAGIARRQYEELSEALKGPNGLAIDDEGNIYVASRNSNTIAVIAPDYQTLIRTIATAGSSQGQLRTPMDVAVSRDGEKIAVAEWGNRRVQVLTMDGVCLNEIIYQQSGRTQATTIQPRGVHFSSDGNIIVAYPTFHQVVKWCLETGGIIWRYGIEGRDRGMLNNPSYIIDGLEDSLLISDTLNNRVVQITSDGMFRHNYPIRRGSGPGRLISPRGITLDSNSSLIVADQGNNRVHFFMPGHVTMMLREIRQMAIANDWQRALPQIERVLYLQPNNEEARDLMVNALYFFGNDAYESGDYSIAENYYRRVLRYRPDDPAIPQKLDTIFWAANQGLITNIVFGIIAVIAFLILLWVFKYLITRYIFSS